jgi:putative chitinase
MYEISDVKKLCPLANDNILNSVLPELNKHCPTYLVTSRDRLVHFIAQIAYESAGFSRLEETLNYSTAKRISQIWPKLTKISYSLVKNPEKLANNAYADKLGNGDEFSGDGWRFRGRGLIQLTGRSNYVEFSSISKVDILNCPDKAAEPETAAIIALSYWASRNCNFYADLNDVQRVTRAINGPRMEGLQARTILTKKAYSIFK